MLALLLLSCGGPEPGAPPGSTDSASCARRVHLDDPGRVCLSPEGLVGSLVAFGGCTELVDQGCSATLNGQRIEIVAWADLDTGGCSTRVCPLDLGLLVEACELPELTDGSWTLAYAGHEVQVQLPLADEICVGDDPPEL